MESSVAVLLWLLFVGALAASAVFLPRVFVALYVGTLIFESAILHFVDVVFAGTRLFPQDLISVALLLLWPLLAAHSQRPFAGPSAWLWLLLAALASPALLSIAGGTPARDTLRDLRPVLQLAIVFPLARILGRDEIWRDAVEWLIRFASAAAYLMLVGVALDWRVLPAAESWMVSTTASATVLRGYGFISSYVFFGLAAYLQIVRMAAERRLGFFGGINTLVLVAAMFATFVRGNLLMFAAMLAAHAAASFLRNSGTARGRIKVAALIGSGAVCFWAAAQTTTYGRAIFERTLSIVAPEVGGDTGVGTYQYRLRSFELAQRTIEQHKRVWLGFGYGNPETMNQERIGYYNHNSYAWLLHRAGYAGLALVLSTLAALLAWYLLTQRYASLTSVVVFSIAAGLLALSGSSGFTFNAYQPTGMVLLAFFIAAADGTVSLAGGRA